MFDILRLPTAHEARNLADRYEQERDQALQAGDEARAQMWGARADAERYTGAYVDGKICTG